MDRVFRFTDAVTRAKGTLARVPGFYRIFRWITTQTGEGKIYSIRSGPMNGFQWRRRNSLPYWYHLGLYEPAVSQLIAEQTHSGEIFWDVGANAGYHTLMACRVVGAKGKVIAVEADPNTAEILRDELAINNVTNCQIVQAAASGSAGTITFTRKANILQSTIGSIDATGEAITVPAIRLDDLVKFGRPNVIKMDIEGGEVMALPGLREVLSTQPRPRLLLSVHGPDASAFCRKFLDELGYQFSETTGFEQMWVAHPPKS